MRKDIIHPKVEGVSMAVVREPDEDGNAAWYVYLINDKDAALENVLVNSQGYGEVSGEQKNTSELRHFFERVEPHSYQRIERIMEELFALSNQYWLSFYLDGLIHDRRYIFLPESILEENFTPLPVMNVRGVLIQ